MDALSALITLLKPQAVVAKMAHGGGRWGVRYSAFGHPSFALVLKGPCWLAPEGMPATIIETGDFILFPSTPAFTLASDPRAEAKFLAPVAATQAVDIVVHGDGDAPPSASLLGGYFTFDPLNARILLDLLPGMLHIRANDAAMGAVEPVIELIKREALDTRPGQAFVLTRLVETLLVEALRSAPADLTATGLLAGLRDPRLAAALRSMHTRTAEAWTLATLARVAGMSRSAFVERFARVVGTTPVNYLLQWRLAVARNLLRNERISVADTALAVGYESASGFSTAFSRETGQSPQEFALGKQKTDTRAGKAAEAPEKRKTTRGPIRGARGS